MNNFITCLLNIINNPDRKDPEYVIAYTILQLGKKINEVSLQELSELCHVSISTLNRFIKKYNFAKYSVFRKTCLQHIYIRMQQLETRVEAKTDVSNMLHCFFNDDELSIIDQSINEIVTQIHDCKRIVFMGSDELIARCLRMQADFIAMEKMTVKESVFESNFYIPDSDEVIFVFSMSGRLIDLIKEPLLRIHERHPYFISVGYQKYIDSNQLLIIPENIDELYEHLLVDYYIQEITYRYFKKYYGA